MRKRMVLISVLIMMVLLPVIAAPRASDSWSTGISLGTEAQGVAQYRLSDGVDLMIGLGLDFYYGAIFTDVVANFRVGGFTIGEAAFDVTVGGGVLVGFYNELVELSVIVPVGITYRIPEEILPVDVYFRIGPSIRILKGYRSDVLGIISYAGVMYRF
jgi:hypothetical protein